MISAPGSAVPLTPQSNREPILDVLRGFAILGILLVNIQFMRGTAWMVTPPPNSPQGSGFTAERLVEFLIGWLASGKFLSSLAIMFGIGAALLARRSLAAGRSPRPLLLRRYCVLMAFGLAHMLLLYPGDILFVYGLTGLILLAFVNLRPRAIAISALALLAGYAIVIVRLVRSYAAPLHAGDHDLAPAPQNSLLELREQSIAAFSEGSYGDVVSAHAVQALTLQGYQLSALPWILGLFLLGYSVGRSGLLDNLAAHRGVLRAGAFFGLVLGLPANFAVGYGGPLGVFAGSIEPGATALLTVATVGQSLGTPILAMGYLCALALYCLRRGPIRPLAAVGRMALTAYLLQSAIALTVITQLRLYEQLSSASALLLTAAIWTVLLVACPLWLRRFRMGPAEWLWRSLSYGRMQPMRLAARPSNGPLT